MGVEVKALSEAPSSGGALVKPQYGVGDRCPECGAAMKRMPSGEVACPECGFGAKKAIGFELSAVGGKEAPWEVKEVARDGVKGLYIRGYASTWMEDRDGDSVARNAFDQSLKSYLEDNPVLLKDHDRSQVLGSVTKGWTDDVGLGVEAFVPKPEQGEEAWKFTAYNDIKRGLRRAFSMGGVFYRRAAKGVGKVIEKVDLFEISNVAVPSNPKSLFRVIAEKGLAFEEVKGDVPGEAKDSGDGDPNSTEDNAANRRAWAKAGYALPDGSYPVLKCGDGPLSVGGAINAMGRGAASNERIRAHIIRNAKRLNCADELPDDWKAAKAAGESDEENGNALKHTHAKVGGGTLTHQHEDATPGHSHEGTLPMPKGKDAPCTPCDVKEMAFNVKAKLAEVKDVTDGDPDSDAGALAQAIDASLDEAIENLQEGNAEQGLALVISAEQVVDSLLDLLGVPDPPDDDDDGKGMRARMIKAARTYFGVKKGNEQTLISYWTEQMGGGQGEPGDFDKCVEALSKHDDIDDPKALCAWIHMQATGAPPGHAPGETDKTYPEVDVKGASGTPRLHAHVPVGGKGPRKLAMVHSHSLDAETEGHRHEGFRPYKHPTTQEATKQMDPEVGKKGAADGKEGAKTVTLSADEYKAMKEAVEGFQEAKRQREVEEAAEAVAATKAAEIEAEERKAAEAQASFVNDVAAAVEAKLAARGIGRANGGRKFVHASSERSAALMPGAKAQGEGEESMIALLYQKAQGDPEARSKLREMSQKAAAEMGVKALVEGTTSGYLVPPQYMQQGIAEYRIAAAKVRQLCTTINGINSNLVYIPRETGIATVGWTSEGSPKPSTDQTFGQLAVNIFTLAGISKVSNQLLEDSNPAVDQIVRKDLGRLLGQAEDIAFLTGTGAGQPTGILNTSGILTGAIGAATLADALASAIAAIQANYYGDPEAIVMNPKHLNVLRTAKDGNNRYIFEPAFFPANSPMMRAFMENNGAGGPNGTLGGGYTNMPGQGGPQGQVWGLPVYSDANLPAPTNAGNAIVAAFSEAYVLERTGVTIDVSSEAGTSFEQNQTWFRGEERLGFTAARQPTAFYTITGLA